jgi:hypothetical protein
MSTPKQRKIHIKRPPQTPMPAAQGRGRRRAWHQAPAGQDAPRNSPATATPSGPACWPAGSLTSALGRPTESSSLSRPTPRRSRHRRDPSGPRGHAGRHNRQSARRQEFHRPALTSARFGARVQRSGLVGQPQTGRSVTWRDEGGRLNVRFSLFAGASAGPASGSQPESPEVPHGHHEPVHRPRPHHARVHQHRAPGISRVPGRVQRPDAPSLRARPAAIRWCQQRQLHLFSARRADIEFFAATWKPAGGPGPPSPAACARWRGSTGTR